MNATDAALKQAGLALDVDAAAQLHAFVALLARHGARSNLVGTTDPARIADEIVVDAARMATGVREVCGSSGRFVDIGAGAGVPSIPLLIALGSGWSAVAIEPREKRCAFMRVARRELGLGARFEVRTGRVEAGERADGAPFDLAVSKAVFAPTEWLERSQPLLGPTGHTGLWLGEGTDVAAPRAWSARYETASGSRREIALVTRGS